MKEQQTRSYYIVALMKYIKGFGGYLTVSILSKLLYKVVPLVLSFLISYMVNTTVLGNDHLLLALCGGILACVALNVLFSFLDIFASHDMSYRILTKLRDKAYDKIDEVAPAATEGKQSGDFISIIINDIEFFEWFYAHILTEWIVVFLISFFALAFMGWLSWILPVVILPFIVIILMIPHASAKKADKQGKAVRDSAGILNAEVIGGVQGLKDVISYRWQQDYFRKFVDAVDKSNEAEIEYAQRSANEKRMIGTVMELASLCTTVCIVLLVAGGAIEPVWLMPMFTLAYAVFLPMQDALALSTNYGFVYGAAKRVFDLFQTETLVQDNGRKTGEDIRNADGTYTVSFEQTRFAYPKKSPNDHMPDVLHGCTFSFRTGETVALVAASGGGKTTAARLLQRFWDVDGGSISINGVDIRELTVHSLRDIVTVVPQDVYLFNESVEDNLKLAKSSAGRDEIIRACQNAQADTFIKDLPDGYQTVIGERGLRLSGGEKQRLSIAQAFLKNSPILVLDEASANLDSENERQINTAVNALKEGRATLVIAHRLSTIRKADRIVVLKEGEVCGDGTYGELYETNTYFRELVGAMGYEKA